MMDNDTLYINRRVLEEDMGRNGFHEILINRKTKKADLYMRVWGVREIYEHEFIEEGTHTIWGFDDEALAAAPEDCLRPVKAAKVLYGEEDIEKANEMVEKMLKQSEDGLCRKYKDGQLEAHIPIPRVMENVECVNYGLNSYIHFFEKKLREDWFHLQADHLFQNAIYFNKPADL